MDSALCMLNKKHPCRHFLDLYAKMSGENVSQIRQNYHIDSENSINEKVSVRLLQILESLLPSQGLVGGGNDLLLSEQGAPNQFVSIGGQIIHIS